MKQIELTQGLVATVDDEDYDRLVQFKWCANRRKDGLGYYAVRHIRNAQGKKEFLSMHRFLLGLSPDSPTQGDHWNGDGLDNRRANLRRCTHTENMRNRKLQRNSTTGFRGVYYESDREKWVARIKVNGKYIHLGRHEDATVAAQSYDRAAVKHFGEFARTNFPIQ